MSSIPDQELEYHYSPSRWTHRMSPEEVIKSHLETVTKGAIYFLVNLGSLSACRIFLLGPALSPYAPLVGGSQYSQWTLDCKSELSYGDSERQKIDVFHKKNAHKKGAPILVYIHGGYWQTKELCREISSFLAVPLCNAGATVISVGYELAPDVSMNTMILQVKKALRLVIKLAKEDQSSGIYLCGHSAGAHLASMMLMSAFSESDASDSELIKGAVLVSGIYDLRPVTKTSQNLALGLTENEAWRLSPLNFVEEIAHQSQHRHIIVVVGEYDPPEFRRQSGEMEKALRDCGVKTSYLDVPDTDHFNVIERLLVPDYMLTKECIHLMRL